MFLKNYTSEVPISRTIARIEEALISCKVSGITKEYDPRGAMTALRFHIKLEDGRELDIRLPADVEGAQEAMWRDYVGADKVSEDGQRLAWYHSRKKKKRADFRQQAERTAWRLMQDWVEVQLSMIQLKQADTAEVFMAYVWDGRQTFYQAIKNNGYRALLADKSEDPE
jgi:hypothetical protein